MKYALMDFMLRRRNKSGRSGFTLTEITVVVGVIGVVAAISFPSFQKSRHQTRLMICMNNLRVYQDALERYEFPNSRYPDSLSTLVSEGYLKTRPQCPSGGSYAWTIGESGVSYQLVCEAPHSPSVEQVYIENDKPPTVK